MTRRAMFLGIAMITVLVLVTPGCSNEKRGGGDADTDTDTDSDTDTETDSCTENDLTCYNQGCGLVCQDDTNCPPGMTCLSYTGQDTGFCTAQCDTGDDTCGCYWHCGFVNIQGGGFTNVCMPGGSECCTDADCGDPTQYVCGLSQEDSDGNGKVDGMIGRCRERVATGAGAGGSCGGGATCYNGLGNCFGADEASMICYAACCDDGDCPAEHSCEVLNLGLPDGEDVEAVAVDVCMAEGQACVRDEDCPEGQVCGIEMKLSPVCIDEICSRQEQDCGDSGDECGQGMDPCYNNTCLGPPGAQAYCFEFCRQGHDEDCDVQDQRCQCINTTDGALFLCGTSGKACKTDEECPQGQVCGMGPNLTVECIEPSGTEGGTRVGSGEECGDASHVCFNDMCLTSGPDSTCYELCDPATEGATPTCPAGQACAAMQLDLGDCGTLELDVCLAVECTPSNEQTACDHAGGERCDPKAYVCVVPGAKALCDADCEADLECGEADDLCLTESGSGKTFCGQGCTVDTDPCPQGYDCTDLSGGQGDPVFQCLPSSGSCP